MYRSGTNVETATRHLAAVLKELHTDPLLIKMFGKQAIPELYYIEWVGRRKLIFGFIAFVYLDSRIFKIFWSKSTCSFISSSIITKFIFQ
jgi:hypothetical protein